MTAPRLRALRAVAQNRVWRWKATGRWNVSGAHPIALNSLLRHGLIRLTDSGEQWRDAELTRQGFEALELEGVLS